MSTVNVSAQALPTQSGALTQVINNAQRIRERINMQHDLAQRIADDVFGPQPTLAVGATDAPAVCDTGNMAQLIYNIQELDDALDALGAQLARLEGL